jgi:microcin C transport system ATP-binding protein
MSHQMMVLKEGRVVEFGETESLISSPQSTYTQHLIAEAF